MGIQFLAPAREDARLYRVGAALEAVLLDSWGKRSRIGDANRIRKWLESGAVRGPQS